MKSAIEFWQRIKADGKLPAQSSFRAADPLGMTEKPELTDV